MKLVLARPEKPPFDLSEVESFEVWHSDVEFNIMHNSTYECRHCT